MAKKKAAPKPRTAPRTPVFHWRGFLLLCAIYVVVALLWHTVWVLPLKLFVVLLHEMSHGIAAVLTGGTIHEIRITADQGGLCETRGGVPWIVVSAGYLGSLLFGATLLLVGTRTRLSPYVAALLGALVAVVALRFMPAWDFGRTFAVAAGFLLALVAVFPPIASELALRVIGVTSCLYAILDIKHDVLDQDHAASDASQLAQITGVPAVVWGIAWIGVSLVVTVITATKAVHATPSARFRD